MSTAAERWAKGLCIDCGEPADPYARCRPCQDAQPKPTVIYDFTSDCQGDYRSDMAREAERQGISVSELGKENG